MRYLFFDIEGANCYNFVSKMCTFGYVITDEKFELKSKIDVIINPCSPFDRHIIRKKIHAYPIETYSTRPPFNYFYKSIKNILEYNDQLIVGWSIDNDVRYVYDACKRYSLKQIQYKYLDLQKVIVKLENLENPPSLESICEKYGIETLISHKSDDDAFLTMKIAQKICENLNISLKELYEKFDDCSSTVKKFASNLLTDEELSNRINRRKIAHLIMSLKQKDRFESEEIKKEDVYAFSVKVIDKHKTNLKTIIRHIYDCGARCANSFSEANVIISDTKSLKHYKQNYESETVKVITYKQLKEMTRLFEKQK